MRLSSTHQHLHEYQSNSNRNQVVRFLSLRALNSPFIICLFLIFMKIWSQIFIENLTFRDPVCTGKTRTQPNSSQMVVKNHAGKTELSGQPRNFQIRPRVGSGCNCLTCITQLGRPFSCLDTESLNQHWYQIFLACYSDLKFKYSHNLDQN